MLNKVNTFVLRGGRDEEIRAAKDLIYLRDVSAAGEGVQEQVSTDLKAMIAPRREHAGRVIRLIGRGDYHLRKVAPRHHGDAARILAEREGISEIDAEAEVEGYLQDLSDILRAAAGSSEGSR